eukprot:214225_1
MLDQVFSDDKGLHYINLAMHNNILAWIEMRTYLYTRGLIIFSAQEIFVVYVIFIQSLSAMFLLWRLMSGTSVDNTYGSPIFVGVLILFLSLTYSLLRVLRTTRKIERLQSKQIALLAAQKFQIYYKRIACHPPKDEEYDQVIANEFDVKENDAHLRFKRTTADKYGKITNNTQNNNDKNKNKGRFSAEYLDQSG